MVRTGRLCDDAAVSGATTIDVGLRMRGELSGPGDVQIRGHFEGTIHVSGSLWIDEGGVVTADVIAARVRVDGRLEGRVRASRQVSVGPKGTLVGDVWGLLAVDEGGVFQGRIVPDSDDHVTEAPRSPAADAPRGLRLEAGDSGPLRLPTKRRVTQPSAERSASDSTAPRRDDALPAPPAAPSAQPPSPTTTPTAKTPRRLVALPRAPLVPTPVFDEPPPAAPSTARLPRITDEAVEQHTTPSTLKTTDRQRAVTPSSDGQPRVPAPPPPPRPRGPTAQSQAHRPPPTPAPPPGAPSEDTLAESWFEEADFLVQRPGTSGEHPEASPAADRPSPRKAPPKKKRTPRRRRE